MRVARGGSAPELRPWIVRYHAPLPGMARRLEGDLSLAAPAAPALKEGGNTRGAMPDERLRKAEEQQAALDAGGFQVVFRVPGRIAVPAGQVSKSFRVASATIAPELMVHAVPALAEAAFLQASFKHGEDAPLLPGPVSVYRDGNGNGVRTREIDSGVDRLLEAPVRLEDLFPGVLIAVPATSATTAVELGGTDLLSFTPAGTATSGTISILGRDGSQFAVRVLGVTGRIRLLRFDPVSGQWLESF